MTPEHRYTESEHEAEHTAEQLSGSAVSEDAFAPLPLPQQSQASQDIYAQPGWSWGAFILGPYFIIAVRRYALLGWYLLTIVPVVNFFVWIGLSVFLGMKGREMAASCSTFSSREQYVGYMKGVDHVGKIIAFLYIVLIGALLVGVAALVILTSLGEARDQHQAEMTQNTWYDQKATAYERYNER